MTSLTTMDKKTAQSSSVMLFERLANLWSLLVTALLLPFWTQQRTLSAHTGTRTVFSTSARQPLSEIVADFFPRKPRWLPERDMPVQTGRVAIVTGGASGIGYEVARGLMRAGARVYVAARSHKRTAEALERLRRQGERWPGEVKLLACDLSDMESVQSAVEEFARQESHLHMLVCNAGVANPASDQQTCQGYDLTLGTNVLGHHQMIQLLLPLLRATAQSAARTNEVRVCIVSSWCHNMHHPSGFSLDDPAWDKGLTMSIVPGTQFSVHVQGPAKEIVRYGHSKFLNVCQAKKLHRMHGEGRKGDDDEKSIVFTSCDPGNNATALLRNRNGITNLLWNLVAIPLFLYHPSYGAITPLWACTAPETSIVGGQYLVPWARISTAAAPTENHDTQDRLFEWCEEQLRKNGF